MNHTSTDTFAPKEGMAAGNLSPQPPAGGPPRAAGVAPNGARSAAGAGQSAPRFAGLKKSLLGVMTGIAAISVLANVLMYYRFTTLRPLVTVGNRVITKREYLAVLDDTAGRSVLNKLVFDELVRQAAARAGVTPTAGEVSAQLAAYQAANPKLAAAIPSWKLRDNLEVRLALDNLRIKGVTATDAEAARYYTAHQKSFTQQSTLQAAMVVADSSTDAATAQHLFQQNVDTRVMARQPQFRVVGTNGFTVDLRQPAHRPILKALFAMRTGEVRIFPYDKQFLVIRVYTNRPGGVAPFREIKEEAARQARLEKAPSVRQELLSLYAADKPTFDIDKYSAFFDNINQSPSASGRPPQGSAR